MALLHTYFTLLHTSPNTKHRIVSKITTCTSSTSTSTWIALPSHYSWIGRRQCSPPSHAASRRSAFKVGSAALIILPKYELKDYKWRGLSASKKPCTGCIWFLFFPLFSAGGITSLLDAWVANYELHQKLFTSQ